jgi:hypothetical protein
MDNTLKNQEIVSKFLASKAFDFVAFGKFVAENGASIASSAEGEFGFVVGHRVIRYCIPPVVRFEGVDPAEVRAEVTGD